MGGSGPTPQKTSNSTGPGSGQNCPPRISTVVSGPAAGISAGDWLDVRLDRTAGPARVILVDQVTQRPVGSLAGIPDLATLIRCLEDNVGYSAYVDRVDGGRIDITVVRD